ncbi:MAG: ABC transporter permease [Microbacterium sp.]
MTRSVRSRRAAGAALAIGALTVAWQAAATALPAALVPSPGATLRTLIALARSGELLESLAWTTLRALVAAALAIAIGTAAGWIASRSPMASGFVTVLRGIGNGVPPVVVAVVVMLWWGADGRVAVAVAALVLFPTVAAASEDAFARESRELREMGRAFGLPRRTVFRRITVPLVAAEIGAAGRVVASSSLRVVLMTEVIAVGSGVGARIVYARSMLLTSEVFAWALVSIAFALAMDQALRLAGRRRRRPLLPHAAG